MFSFCASGHTIPCLPAPARGGEGIYHLYPHLVASSVASHPLMKPPRCKHTRWSATKMSTRKAISPDDRSSSLAKAMIHFRHRIQVVHDQGRNLPRSLNPTPRELIGSDLAPLTARFLPTRVVGVYSPYTKSFLELYLAFIWNRNWRSFYRMPSRFKCSGTHDYLPKL